MDEICRIKIQSFEPLVIEFGDVAEAQKGRIELPPLRVMVHDLSLDGLLDGRPGIYGDANIACVDVGPSEEEPIKMLELAEIVLKKPETFEVIHKAFQEAVDKHGALIK